MNIIEELIEVINNDNYVSVCCIKFQSNDQQNRDEEIGKLLDTLQNISSDYFFKLVMWGNLFLLSTKNKNEFEHDLNPILLDANTNYIDNFSIFDDLRTDENEIEKQLDVMGLQLNKINYWEKHPYEYYFKNGKKIFLGEKH